MPSIQDLQSLGLQGQFVVTGTQNGTAQLQQIQSQGGNSIMTIQLPSNQQGGTNPGQMAFREFSLIPPENQF